MPEPTDPQRRRWLAAGLVAPLAGCAHLGDGEDAERPTVLGDWREVRLPGKRPTRYRWAKKEGREAIEAHAEQSASMLRRTLKGSAPVASTLDFSWWVPDIVATGHVAKIETEDSSARLLLAFGGDVSRLSSKTRVMFELAEALTGETPPFATLMYVWCATAPVDSLVVNPRTDRVRKIVVDSGREQLGRWREHRRDIAADFRRAYGEAPGPLLSVAVMTDADNTASSARAWYGPVRVT